MKRCLLYALCSMLLASLAPAADAVEPAQCTTTNLRSEAIGNVSAAFFSEGSTLLFTNCVVYSGSTTSSAVQGLDGVTVGLRVGSTSSNIAYSATVQDAATGKWWARITVPANLPTTYLQVTVTDANTNSYVYPWKMIKTSEVLQ